jgi:uncharacterized protein YutE (UPF0331/DUF86 family)
LTAIESSRSSTTSTATSASCALVPERFEEYEQLERKRACERTVQLCIEAVIDTCALLVIGLRLGLPGDPDDLFEKLADGGAITPALARRLTEMKGLRNILVHEYGRIDDHRVFRTLQEELGDFETFKREILAFVRTLKR